MTRFARAKGSKSSNLKAPEDSTPWEVMKEQLLKAKVENEESKKRKEAEQQRIDNYEKFLQERKVEKRKAEWCDFPEAHSKKLTSKNIPEKMSKNIVTNNNVETVNEFIHCNNHSKKTKKKKNKSKHVENIKESNFNSVEDPANNVDQNTPKGEKKEKKLKKSIQSNNSNTTPVNKIQNKKSKKSKDIVEANQVKGLQENNESNLSRTKQLKQKKHGTDPIRRKGINDHSFQLIINGKDVDLVRFEGFPIMKKDAERLQELKNSMIKKGIPKIEVQRTIKLERRRAEKALARLKRDVCYNCRKGGHNLSDCPDLKSNIPGVDSADGVCFKCGSTEHRQNECKVQRDKEFRFATCFICRETGHLARQCPDNPKGLYPNGGCCKLCGDVTHLRKDCPTVSEKKEGTSIKLSTLDGEENIEDIGQSTQVNITSSPVPSKKPKKIKF